MNVPATLASPRASRAALAAPSRLASWRAIENAADRYASYGALCVGAIGAVVLLLVL